MLLSSVSGGPFDTGISANSCASTPSLSRSRIGWMDACAASLSVLAVLALLYKVVGIRGPAYVQIVRVCVSSSVRRLIWFGDRPASLRPPDTVWIVPL